jgi:hypothetical protein
MLLLSGPRNKAWLCSGFDRPAEICSLDTGLNDDWAEKADFVLFDPHENGRLTQNLEGLNKGRKLSKNRTPPKEKNWTMY